MPTTQEELNKFVNNRVANDVSTADILRQLQKLDVSQSMIIEALRPHYFPKVVEIFPGYKNIALTSEDSQTFVVFLTYMKVFMVGNKEQAEAALKQMIEMAPEFLSYLERLSFNEYPWEVKPAEQTQEVRAIIGS